MNKIKKPFPLSLSLFVSQKEKPAPFQRQPPQGCKTEAQLWAGSSPTRNVSEFGQSQPQLLLTGVTPEANLHRLGLAHSRNLLRQCCQKQAH